MNQPTIDTQARAVMGNFNLTAQLPQGQTISFTGYMFEGESVESLNGRIDLLNGVMLRQRGIAEIPELELVLETKVKRLDELRAHYAALEHIKSTGGKLKTDQMQMLSQMDINLKHLTDEIAKGAKAVSDLKAKWLGLT